jgi:hypothetical protein
VTQHASLSAERWASFTLDQQVLMIANEMQRASSLLAPDRDASLRLAYERVLRLVDLTVAVQPKRTLRRELLRWRDLVAALYVAPHPDRSTHRDVFRCLLQLRPEASRQIPLLLGRRDDEGA